MGGGPAAADCSATSWRRTGYNASERRWINDTITQADPQRRTTRWRISFPSSSRRTTRAPRLLVVHAHADDVGRHARLRRRVRPHGAWRGVLADVMYARGLLPATFTRGNSIREMVQLQVTRRARQRAVRVGAGDAVDARRHGAHAARRTARCSSARRSGRRWRARWSSADCRARGCHSCSGCSACRRRCRSSRWGRSGAKASSRGCAPISSPASRTSCARRSRRCGSISRRCGSGASPRRRSAAGRSTTSSARRRGSRTSSSACCASRAPAVADDESREPIDAAAEVRRIVEEFEPLAAARGATVMADTSSGAAARCCGPRRCGTSCSTCSTTR